MPRSSSIPVIDLFAGPGGLGEGFSAYRTIHGDQPFHVVLSIEKDTQAHSTLRLRSFVRQFGDDIPKDYYAFLADTETPLNKRIDSLFDKYPAEARAAHNEAWRAELGAESGASVRERIASALGDADPWVLIGGPPCQAYSLAGRSRNKGNADYVAEEDGRQFLYVEYLQVIADHQPAVFVMENVKGLLSATLKNQRIFDQIVKDLTDPATALRREGLTARCQDAGTPGAHYAIFSLTERGIFDEGELQDFVVRMEDYGIPQARHRLILLGIRKDICGSHRPGTLQKLPRIAARDVLDGLPRIRSGLSRTADCSNRWLAEVARAATRKWFEQAADDIREQLARAVDNLRAPVKDRGAEFVQYTPSVRCHESWYLDERLAGVCNHATRSHIVPDLHRYLYAACFSLTRKRSPTLGDFPRALLPKHSNARDALDGSNFADRFRVQRRDRHATTVTSHIAKDGHYYIHYDPTQCRSLTVREAARLQTFPDNYFFCGPRTAQYAQVGNAVPPLLSRGIAQIVLQLLVDTGAA